jgi:hypothetical protein
MTGGSPVPFKPRDLLLLSFPHWNGVYCLVLGTPLPLRLQNLENKRSVLRLAARSLSFQKLRAKSRQHGS